METLRIISLISSIIFLIINIYLWVRVNQELKKINKQSSITFDYVLELLSKKYGMELGDSIPYKVTTTDGEEVVYADCGNYEEDFSKVTERQLMSATVTNLEYTNNFYDEDEDDPDAIIKPGINITIEVRR